MKKEYTNPTIEIICLDVTDIVTASGPNTFGDGGLPGYEEDSTFLG